MKFSANCRICDTPSFSALYSDHGKFRQELEIKTFPLSPELFLNKTNKCGSIGGHEEQALLVGEGWEKLRILIFALLKCAPAEYLLTRNQASSSI